MEILNKDGDDADDDFMHDSIIYETFVYLLFPSRSHNAQFDSPRETRRVNNFIGTKDLLGITQYGVSVGSANQ